MIHIWCECGLACFSMSPFFMTKTAGTGLGFMFWFNGKTCHVLSCHPSLRDPSRGS